MLAAILFLLGTAGVSSLTFLHAQDIEKPKEPDKRRQLVESEVKLALKEATEFAERGPQLVDNLSAWKVALDAAQSAVRRAERLLKLEPALAKSDLAKEVQKVKARVASDQKDQRLLDELDRIRLEQAEGLGKAHLEYQKVFQKYGILPDSQEPKEAAEAIRQRPATVREQVVDLLDEVLSRLPSKEAKLRTFLAAVLAEADPDPWRQKVRQAVLDRDQAALKQLAQQAEVKRQRPEFLISLGNLLPPSERRALLRRMQQHYPSNFWVNFELAVTLHQSVSDTGPNGQGKSSPQLDEATAFYRAALALRPTSAAVLNNLGLALADKQDLDAAIASYRKALELDPSSVQSHINLGTALMSRGDLAAAIACFHKAIALKPDQPKAYNNLGIALRATGDIKGALASFREALRLDPKDPRSYNNLGMTLYQKKDLDGAIAAFRSAIRLDPANASSHHNLGLTLQAKKRLPEAIAEYRKALELDPKLVQAYSNLGRALLLSGRLPEGQAAIKRALELLSPAQQSVHRYNAACAAVLAAAGKDKEAAPLADKDKARFRQQALDWLRDNLKYHQGQLADRDATKRTAAQRTLQHWQKDPDLESVRDARALAALPREERDAWQQLWADAAKLLEKTREGS
jgi:tetratricopeptide (TPR) repeat protein